MSSAARPALYFDGRAPLFLDLAETTFTFADRPPITAQLRIAHVDYENATAVAVFSEHDREAIGVFGPHVMVRLDQLTFVRRGPAWSPDLHELAVQTLERLPSGIRISPDQDGLELLAAARLIDRRRILRAEEAIGDCAHYSDRETYSYDCTMNTKGHSSAHFARLAGQARDTALTRLSRLTDTQALTVIAGTRLPDLDGSSFPIASIKDVQNRRVHLRAAAHMMRRLQTRHAKRARIKHQTPEPAAAP